MKDSIIMHIVFNVDNGFVPHMCVTILSILGNCTAEKPVFHVLTYNLSFENREYVSNLVTEKGTSVFFYDVDVSRFKGFPLGDKTGNARLTFAAYLRLLIPDLLPQNLDKVLYMDCDIVVINPIYDLWNKDLTGYYLAALDDYGQGGISGARRLGIGEEYSYFNSGVMLLNLKMLREMNFFDKVKEYVKTNWEKIIMHDQDILNALLYKKKLTMEVRWNMMCNTDNTIDYAVIHYAGMKPWYVECPHPLKCIYFDYLSLTKWNGMKPVHCYSLWQRFKRSVHVLLKTCKL